MGNCIGLKQRKKEEEMTGQFILNRHPLVSRWLASCDFSSIPDSDCIGRSSTDISFDTVEIQRSGDLITTDTVIMGQELADLDGYLTATENLESEGEGTSVGIPEAGPFNPKNTESVSAYETSDELEPCVFQGVLATDKLSLGSSQVIHTPPHKSNENLSLKVPTDEEEDMVEELELVS
uniref:Sister chromatid cohesion 1 protein 2 n=1 Tax=Heterorhabditis bacteriophora TaxID=37862 RepID=A0A1I7XAJ3_HETBA